MAWLFAWLQNFVSWIYSTILGVLAWLFGLISDVLLILFDAVLQGVAALIVAIPVPDFLAHGLSGLFGGLPGSVLFFLGVFQVPAGLAMIGAAVGFRLLRKVATLFQW